jgi:SSS family solute:Na+ symporter
LQQLPAFDIAVLVAYVLGVVVFGCWFVRRSRTTEGFVAAGRSLPGWAVGLSIFGTYLSSNTFIGVPGKAYGANWGFFTFSLSLPIAAVIAVAFFVPFYRRSGEISAYHHLEKRFGPWARTYSMVCYVLWEIGRIATILYGVSKGVSWLTGLETEAVILVAGALITLYTLLGGIEAVIWTDVAQSIVLIAGAGVVALLLVFGMPDGPGQAVSIAADAGKFSLGSFDADATKETFWAVLLFGIFANLNNFGIRQGYVQRYHAARSDRDARRAVWSGALLYIPVSLLFFFIGSSLFSYYNAPGNEALLADLKAQAAVKALAGELPVDAETPEQVRRAGFGEKLDGKIAELKPEDFGDDALPHFIRNKLRYGLAGLLIAALFAAAMSSIDTSLNSSATVILSDVYKRYVHPHAGERASMRVLYVTTFALGAVGTVSALGMIGAASVLDIWWKISGTLSGALLGLFLLGLIARKAGNVAAATGVVIGLIVIFWLSFSTKLTFLPKFLHSPLTWHLTSVIGTLSIFLVGVLVSWFAGRSRRGA